MRKVTNDEFARLVMESTQSMKPFVPAADYDPDGDCIEFLTKPDPFYAKRIDNLLTVYHSQYNDEVIGSYIKGVSVLRDDLLKRYPGFAIEIHSGKVKLAHLFLAKMWSEPQPQDEILVMTYRQLIEKAQESNAEADLCGC